LRYSTRIIAHIVYNSKIWQLNFLTFGEKMKILRCLFCGEEVNVVKEIGYVKKVKCNSCCHGCEDHGHANKEPEVYYVRGRGQRS